MPDIERAEIALKRVKALKWNFKDSNIEYFICLIKEYIRDAKGCAKKFDMSVQYPFFDICKITGIKEGLPIEMKNNFNKWAQEQLVPKDPVINICYWYVKESYFQDCLENFETNICSFYEPLLKIFEKEGYFFTEHGFLCLGNTSIPLWSNGVGYGAIKC